MTALIAILIVIQHFVFDFILQPRWVAVSKSKSYRALFFHGLIVAIGFWTVAALVYPIGLSAIVAVVYGVLHMIQDRLVWGSFKPATDNPYQEKSFWNTLAIDQTIHLVLAILLLSARLESLPIFLTRV